MVRWGLHLTQTLALSGRPPGWGTPLHRQARKMPVPPSGGHGDTGWMVALSFFPESSHPPLPATENRGTGGGGSRRVQGGFWTRGNLVLAGSFFFLHGIMC